MTEKQQVEEGLLRLWLGNKYDHLALIHGHDTVFKAFSRANDALSGGFSLKRRFLLSAVRIVGNMRMRLERFQEWLEA